MNALVKKLQIKPNCMWLFINAPEGYLSMLEPLPENVNIFYTGGAKCDGVQLFVKNNAQLAEELDTLQPMLKHETVIWITFPKKKTKIPTDLEMMSSWDAAKKYNLRPVAPAAIDKIWTALRFKPEEQVKEAEFRNSRIREQNEYSEYIDVDAKTVKLPKEVMEVLKDHPAALNHFEKLAYSHKKEYVVWIVSAKQEKTKQARIEKMLEMLSKGKKNPSEK